MPDMRLVPLEPDAGRDVYDMLQHIARDDNGFHNSACGMSWDEYRAWLARECEYDRGNLEDWMVPQSSYWLYRGREPIGYGRLRHRLNAALEQGGGHIGYAIAAPHRGQGYGNALLRLLLEEAGHLGLEWVQVATNVDNAPSNRMLERLGGRVLRTCEGRNIYRILLPARDMSACPEQIT